MREDKAPSFHLEEQPYPRITDIFEQRYAREFAEYGQLSTVETEIQLEDLVYEVLGNMPPEWFVMPTTTESQTHIGQRTAAVGLEGSDNREGLDEVRGRLRQVLEGELGAAPDDVQYFFRKNKFDRITDAISTQFFLIKEGIGEATTPELLNRWRNGKKLEQEQKERIEATIQRLLTEKNYFALKKEYDDLEIEIEQKTGHPIFTVSQQPNISVELLPKINRWRELLELTDDIWESVQFAPEISIQRSQLEDIRRDLALQLDCKLPASVMAFLLKELQNQEKLDIQEVSFFLSSSMAAHLNVRVRTTQDDFVIDFSPMKNPDRIYSRPRVRKYSDVVSREGTAKRSREFVVSWESLRYFDSLLFFHLKDQADTDKKLQQISDIPRFTAPTSNEESAPDS